MAPIFQRFLRDPRYPQIAVLAGLLVYGVVVLDFEVPPLSIPAALIAALLTEALVFHWRRAADRPRPPYESALISALSSLILFRTSEVWAAALVAAIAVLSKAVVTIRGRHFINPTNGAVLFGAAFLPGWISSGQWGHQALLIFVLCAGASLTLTRAARIDTALAFLGGTALLQALRHFVIGYSWASVGHLFSSGSLWLFALYMITDPRTTPQARWARIAHGSLVALGAVSMAQLFWVRDSFLWSLLLFAPLVPLADAWTRRPQQSKSGGVDVQMGALDRAGAELVGPG